MNLAVLASGRGSNFDAICENFKTSELFPKLLVTDQANALVLEKAQKRGVPAYHLPFPTQSREEAAEKLNEILQRYSIEFIVLAGFMKVLPTRFVRQWKNRIMNIHPSLLPRYPGTHAIERAWEAGDEIFGITIHLVDEGVDTGPVLFQNMFHRLKNDTLESIEEKIHRMEHRDYPRIIKNYIQTLRRSPS